MASNNTIFRNWVSVIYHIISNPACEINNTRKGKERKGNGHKIITETASKNKRNPNTKRRSKAKQKSNKKVGSRN